MRWLWVLLLAPAITFAGIGTVEHDQGRTWNERAAKTENIDVGYDVLMDDFYQTGEDGQIGIVFEDDTTITVIENSELLIDDFVYDPASGIGQLAFNVTVGSFRYVSGTLAANNAGTVKITTPSATITVRGTTLTGNVTPGGATTITLLRDADGGLGMVTVANRAGSVNLTRPFHTVTVATINTRPPLPIIPTPAELGAMNLILEPIMDETPSQPDRQEQHEEEEEEEDEEEEVDEEEDTEEDVEDEDEAVEEDEEVEELDEEIDEEIIDEEDEITEEEVTEGDERDTELEGEGE
ncbi:FecR domain-containing protein, partial [Marine Group I thaumarchaeote]|nr:FecR domain-containing protein [Marine Group I thaumarchaeote]